MIRKLNKDENGFTLVELIVVMIILAILAALLVPALVSYIDEAKDKQIIVNGRTCLVAAQAAASEEYGTGADFNTLLAKYTAGDLPTGSTCTPTKADGVVTQISYSQDGKTATWIKGQGTWTVTDSQ
ncbi:MAG: type II secretion system protein [Erysipelotrichaceae bacterium]|nr:type II secretion system protein [Erysipelotrichaceae bacterium]